jgi:hypothetical protein
LLVVCCRCLLSSLFGVVVCWLFVVVGLFCCPQWFGMSHAAVSPSKFDEGVVLQHFRLQDLITMGTAVVYTAVDQRDDSMALVKIARVGDEREHGVDSSSQIHTEHDLLTGPLLSCPGVPVVLGFGTVTHKHDGLTTSVPVLVESPVGLVMTDPSFDPDGQQLDVLGWSLYSTLVEIHRRGVLHRDVKPQNVVVVNGEPILIDLGLGCRRDDPDRLKKVFGTPAYMSSQLSSGSPCSESTDIDSLLLTIQSMEFGRSEWEKLNHPTERPQLSPVSAAFRLQRKIQDTHRASNTPPPPNFVSRPNLKAVAAVCFVSVLSAFAFKLRRSRFK